MSDFFEKNQNDKAFESTKSIKHPENYKSTIYKDNRPETRTWKTFQKMTNSCERAQPFILDSAVQAKETVQREKKTDGGDSTSGEPGLAQGCKNKTGLPNNLKIGMENLSGKSLDYVKVHYNSSKPASVQAHAYAQGSEIHMASGQEKHLPHELGHVVQQMEGWVKPTGSVAGVAVNDNAVPDRRNHQPSNDCCYERQQSSIASQISQLRSRQVLHVHMHGQKVEKMGF